MTEPEKPFACTMPDCGMTFTNEDHLHVHTKKHDMVLQFGCEQKGAFVADQTPTPTRFIRNCEEVGLFQDLQNVNPFDEGFKRAMEAKQDLLLESMAPSEELHTPQMFPLLEPADSVYTTNHRNITISRSSSDENGVKEFETTTISKLTNEVTTISRVVSDEPRPKEMNCVSYTNNIVKIHNVGLRKDTDRQTDDMPTKDKPKDLYDRLQLEVPQIMSQKSIDYVVDSLTTDYVDHRKEQEKTKERPKEDPKDYEVILKLPSGAKIKLTHVEEKQKTAKETLKKVLTEKLQKPPVINNLVVPSVIPVLPGGTLIPVSVVNTTVLPKIPLRRDVKSVKRKSDVSAKEANESKRLYSAAESRSAAGRRYRARLKEYMTTQAQENQQLKQTNERLVRELAALKSIILEHVKTCHSEDELRALQESISKMESRN